MEQAKLSQAYSIAGSRSKNPNRSPGEYKGIEAGEKFVMASEANSLLDSLNLYINAVSGTCGLVVVGLVLLINIIDPRLMDRVSIRFTLAISFVDFLKAGMIVAYSKHFSGGLLCTVVAFSTQWLTLLYLFLNVAIAINLQLVFVKGYAFNPVWERLYWITSFFMATILPTFSLVGGKLGSSGREHACEYKNPNSFSTCKWVFSTYLAWILASCAYCTVVVVLTILTLRRKATVLDRLAGTDMKAHEVKCDIQRLIRRVALYCIIPVVTQTGFLLGRATYCVTELPFTLNLVAIIGTDIPGILNLIAFFIDPAFSNAVRTIISERYHIKPPSHLRHPKEIGSEAPWSSNTSPESFLEAIAMSTSPRVPLEPVSVPEQHIVSPLGRRGKREVHSYHASHLLHHPPSLAESRSRHSVSGINPTDFESLESSSILPLASIHSGNSGPNLDTFLKGL
ncbi:hypothetical protein DSO57_1024064 [Entomophthora muscae]|uniref:Uncharacterized protein n=1 Tax=Entomophthora muscae TaxID=34485 RepID=A0ACC2RTM4_9FUNG|nr:hypothetical protein DSO57_1024064 [Entomophthora muscae]